MEIVKITTEKFKAPSGYFQPSGLYCLRDKRGYLAFKSAPAHPYSPQGGKKALQAILDAGGFASEEDLIFLQPMEERLFQIKLDELREAEAWGQELASVETL